MSITVTRQLPRCHRHLFEIFKPFNAAGNRIGNSGCWALAQALPRIYSLQRIWLHGLLFYMYTHILLILTISIITRFRAFARWICLTRLQGTYSTFSACVTTSPLSLKNRSFPACLSGFPPPFFSAFTTTCGGLQVSLYQPGEVLARA
jgi:hypothetical protein